MNIIVGMKLNFITHTNIQKKKPRWYGIETNTEQNTTEQGKTRHNKTGQNRTERNGTELNRINQ